MDAKLSPCYHLKEFLKCPITTFMHKKGYTLPSCSLLFSFMVKIMSRKGNISSAVLLKKDVSASCFLK